MSLKKQKKKFLLGKTVFTGLRTGYGSIRKNENFFLENSFYDKVGFDLRNLQESS